MRCLGRGSGGGAAAGQQARISDAANPTTRSDLIDYGPISAATISRWTCISWLSRVILAPNGTWHAHPPNNHATTA